MNKLLKLTSLGFMALALVTTSCSDDDNDSNEPAAPAGPSTETVLPGGLPATIDGTTFTTNDKGQVTRIADGSNEITFEYGSFSRATTFDVLMKIRDAEYPDEDSDVYMQTNSQGFVTYAVQVYIDPTEGEDTWRFEYDADGRMTRLQRSEGGDDFKITYTAGDITEVVQDETNGDHREYTIAYTNTEFTSPVANKCNLMLFDNFFQIDMDQMGVAYFAGLLGKSTVNLPMGYTVEGTEDDSPYTYSETYHWTFDASNRPTKFWSGEYDYDAVTFTWK